jgi:hypothetical protein
MKFITAIVLTALLSFAIALFQFFPWWCFVPCTLIVAVAIPQQPWKAFLSGFAALFVLWIVLACLSDIPNEHILSKRVADMLHLGSYIVLILVTGTVGGLLAGLAALTGSYVRK